MYQRAMFCLAVLIGLTANGQTINLRGVVTNGLNVPIANASITLVRQGLQTTSAATTGAYSITRSTAIQLPALSVQTGKIVLNKGVLELSLPSPSPITVEVFDVKGNLLKKETALNAAAGACRINLADNTRAASLLVVKLSIGKRTMFFRYMPLNTGIYLVDPSSESSPLVPVSGNDLAALAAAIDSLRATVNGYTSKTIPVSTYDSTVNIILDSVPGPSVGCGKSLGSLKTGTYTITSAGLSRQYIIDIPANYDMNHPYRLIFGMHCMFSKDTTVANEKYYQLKRFADSTKNYCIFVAPNGVISTSGTYSGYPMWNMGDTDHIFVDDMLKLFKGELCVDTTRIFCSGFSFGAMFTYSLSTDHQKQFRAVACFAPANWNIWLPTDKHLPLAYMSTTGMSDPNCPLVYNATLKQGGEYCALGHATDNGCTIPATIPMTTVGSKTHVIYDFQGCKNSYPVKICTFDGGHQCYVVDGTSGTDDMTKSWIPGETWKFFMQF